MAYPTGVYPLIGNTCTSLSATTLNCSSNGSAPFVTYNKPNSTDSVAA